MVRSLRLGKHGSRVLRNGVLEEVPLPQISQSYVPPDESDDKAIKRGMAINAAFPPHPKPAVHN